MFEIGFWEIILILIISIIILNPNDYKELFYNIGKIINNLKSQKEKLNKDLFFSLEEKEEKKENKK